MEADGRDVRRIWKGYVFENVFASPLLHALDLEHLDQRLPVVGATSAVLGAWLNPKNPSLPPLSL